MPEASPRAGDDPQGLRLMRGVRPGGLDGEESWGFRVGESKRLWGGDLYHSI